MSYVHAIPVRNAAGLLLAAVALAGAPALACWIARKTRSKSCSCKSYPDRASRSSTHPAGSCSSTGKNPAPRSRRAEENDPMRLRTAVIGMIALAALAGCGGYTASGPYGGGGGGGGYGGGGAGGDGGPVGSVTVGTNGQIVFISAHNSTANPAV